MCETAALNFRKAPAAPFGSGDAVDGGIHVAESVEDFKTHRLAIVGGIVFVIQFHGLPSHEPIGDGPDDDFDPPTVVVDYIFDCYHKTIRYCQVESI